MIGGLILPAQHHLENITNLHALSGIVHLDHVVFRTVVRGDLAPRHRIWGYIIGTGRLGERGKGVFAQTGGGQGPARELVLVGMGLFQATVQHHDPVGQEQMQQLVFLAPRHGQGHLFEFVNQIEAEGAPKAQKAVAHAAEFR